MSLPSLILSQSWSTTGRKKGEEARGPTRLGRRCRVRVQAAPLLLPHGRPAVGGERAGGEGRSPHGAAVRRRRRWSGATTARRGVPMRPSAMDLDVAPATTYAVRRLAQPQYPRRRGSSAPPVLPPAAARSRPRQRWWRRRGRGAALGQMRGRGGDEDGKGSLRRSYRPWGGRSPAAT